jgi:predicted nuclease of predicted toxin-antitoxin system
VRKKVLLDGCVPRRLGRALPESEVSTVPEMGWGNLDDGPLLTAMSGQFDALVTTDKGLPRQQRISGRSFAVIVLRAVTNRLDDLLPLVPKLKKALETTKPGEVCEVGSLGEPHRRGE